MKNYLIKLFVYFIFLSFSASVISAESRLLNGEYITENGWGVLTIVESKNETEFTIFAMGANGHTCDINGVINNGKAKLEEGCLVDFEQKNMFISVSPSQECHLHCGMRAWFKGDYLKPPKGCLSKEQQNRSQNFKALYQKHLYQSALKQAQSLLNDCQSVMGEFQQYDIKNDIAITQYHLGDNRGCLATLKTIDVNQSEDGFKEILPPLEADVLIGVAKAKRTNLTLCNKKSSIHQ
jgi:hypothetical protein